MEATNWSYKFITNRKIAITFTIQEQKTRCLASDYEVVIIYCRVLVLRGSEAWWESIPRL